MKKYNVTIIETLKMEVEVEAHSHEEARHIVAAKWDNCDYILDSDHFEGVSFEARRVKEHEPER